MKQFTKILLVSTLLVLGLGCKQQIEQAINSNESPTGKEATLTVYKDPNCGCCSKWIDHLEEHNISVKAVNTGNMDSVKQQKNIPMAYQSCHTGVSKEGYFFEGHVPAKTIARFLKEKPAGMVGLTVPAMPVGSPGMEVKDKFMPYKVFAMDTAGVMTVYEEFNTYEEQF